MWEQVDPAGIPGVTTAGTQLTSQTKTNGVVFRQLGVTADISPTDTLLYNSPGLNLAGTNPTRTFPDMLQILAGNTNAKTGRCEYTMPAATGASVAADREARSASASRSGCRPASGAASSTTAAMTFRLTARDGLASGGGVGFAETKVTVAKLAGPFQVTSIPAARGHLRHDHRRPSRGTSAGTDVAADQRRQREDLALHRRRPDLPDHAARQHAERRLGRRHVPAGHRRRGPHQGRGDRQRVLRRQRRRLRAARPLRPPRSGGTVPATLSLTLGAPARSARSRRASPRRTSASTTANVISTAGDALLSVADPSVVGTGHLVNGTFSLPQPLQARARNAANTGTAYNNVGSSASPLNLLTWNAPISNDAVTLEFWQLVKPTTRSVRARTPRR